MPKRRIVDIRNQVPLLDVASYGRRGPGHRPLSKAEFTHISRTVRRLPEVVVKVSGGARSLRGVGQHLDYIGREGRGEVQTDDGERLQGRGFERALLEDWDLDLEAHRRHTERAIAAGRGPPKLLHNIVFSMPKGTPPVKVLRAVQVFAREKFALRHRYLMAFHLDQGHPHVHMDLLREQKRRLLPTVCAEWSVVAQLARARFRHLKRESALNHALGGACGGGAVVGPSEASIPGGRAEETGAGTRHDGSPEGLTSHK
jgi:hypothetical protein